MTEAVASITLCVCGHWSDEHRNILDPLGRLSTVCRPRELGTRSEYECWARCHDFRDHLRWKLLQ